MYLLKTDAQERWDNHARWLPTAQADLDSLQLRTQQELSKKHWKGLLNLRALFPALLSGKGRRSQRSGIKFLAKDIIHQHPGGVRLDTVLPRGIDVFFAQFAPRPRS